MKELISYLNTIKPLSPSLTERIKKIFQSREFAKGSFILREGENNDPVIFVVSGLLHYYQIEQSRELSKCFLQRNDMLINGTAAAGSLRASGFIEALATTRVMLCPKTELEHVYGKYPEFEHHGRILTYRSYVKMYAVLDNIRMRTAKERYQFLQREYPDLELSVPDRYLASFIGVNRVTLSRIRGSR